MDINDLPGNSQYNKTEEEKPKVKPVISKDSLVKNDDFVSKVKKTLFSDDVLNEVVWPGIKNLALDGLEMIFFHDGGRRYGDRRRDSYYYDNASYRYDSHYRYADRRDSPSDYRDNGGDSRRDHIDYRNIILKNREDAEKIVEDMRYRCDKYGSVSVAELFDMIGVTGEYTDNDWGWKDPRDISYRRVSRGFLIIVPEARYVK